MSSSLFPPRATTAGLKQPPFSPAAPGLRAGAARGAVVIRCSAGEASSSSPMHPQRQQQKTTPSQHARWYAQDQCSPSASRQASNSLTGDTEPPTTSAPPAASTATDQAQDQDRLHRSLRLNPFWSSPGRRAMNLLEATPGTLLGLPEIHVIVFGSGDQEHEGVYSHRAMGKDGLPQDTVVGFESKDDADRYACMLEVTMEPHVPHVMHLPALDLAEFCVERGYQCQVQPVGSHLLPPERNVDLTDWERSQRLRRDQFLVVDVEEAPAARSHVLGSEPQLQELCIHEDSASGASGTSASEAVLDVLRRQLEALLPPSEEVGANDAGL